MRSLNILWIDFLKFGAILVIVFLIYLENTIYYSELIS